MFRNYFITAARHILRHKLYSLINILGLAVGVAACLLIFLFVRYETSYDSWMPNAENIYRLNYVNYYKNGENYTCGCAPGIAKGAVDERFAEVEQSTRMFPMAPVFTIEEKSFKEDVWMVERNFFDVFELQFLEGDRATAFDDLLNIVISSRMSKKFFGAEPALGKVLSFSLRRKVHDFKIVGVFEDLPENSEFSFEIIFPLDLKLHGKTNAVNASWHNTWGYLYLKLKDGTDPAVISSQLSDLVAKNVPPIDDRKVTDVIELSIINIQDIHLYSALHPSGPFTGLKPLGSIKQVYTFIGIAGLILLIACINFINLSTARSLLRAKEVSLRKVLGANRGQLVRQFLGENILVAAAGLLVALVLVDITLPSFNAMLDIKTASTLWTDPTLIGVSIGLLVFIGFVAGLYPAVYLSAFLPAKILNGDIVGGRSKASTFRTSLTIFQFATSITLIIATAVVYSQNIYSLNKDMGFSKENTLVVNNLRSRFTYAYRESFAQEVARMAAVESVSQSLVGPVDFVGWHSSFQIQGQSGSEAYGISHIGVDASFFDQYEIPVLYGRNFDKDRVRDRISSVEVEEGQQRPLSSTIINQSAARQFGFAVPQDALGQILTWGDDKLEIIGVVADYHHQSMKEPTRAFVFVYDPRLFGVLNIKYLNGTDTSQFQSDVTAIWNKLMPNVPIQSAFLVDQVAALYAAETKQNQMLLAFSVLAIVVACLGLYGLAAFTAEQQAKAIAIRKVHGAAVWDVVKLLLLQFSKPVLIANFLAWPIAWYAMTGYLEGFTFRIDLNPLFFIATGLTALVIAWMTTSYHALKAARTNPAVILKSE